MKKHLILFLLITTLVYSQQEASVWYFGINAGIRFNTDGTVTALTDGQLNTSEGCATISDNTGNLLFYTDGITVYNRNHTVMINGNGLTGNWSTTQSRPLGCIHKDSADLQFRWSSYGNAIADDESKLFRPTTNYELK